MRLGVDGMTVTVCASKCVRCSEPATVALAPGLLASSCENERECTMPVSLPDATVTLTPYKAELPL